MACNQTRTRKQHDTMTMTMTITMTMKVVLVLVVVIQCNRLLLREIQKRYESGKFLRMTMRLHVGPTSISTLDLPRSRSFARLTASLDTAVLSDEAALADIDEQASSAYCY